MSTTNTLTDIANKLGTDKGTEHFEAHSYTEVYDSLFYLWRENNIKMLEVGIWDPRFPGASVRMWKEYFPYLKFVGFDINPQSRVLESADTHVFIGDASKPEDLLSCGNSYYDNYDIIIDDGSHRSEHIINAFHMLFPFVKPGGFYIIEDLHCQQAKAQETIRDLCFIIESEKHKVQSKVLEAGGKMLVIKKGV